MRAFILLCGLLAGAPVWAETTSCICRSAMADNKKTCCIFPPSIAAGAHRLGLACLPGGSCEEGEGWQKKCDATLKEQNKIFVARSGRAKCDTFAYVAPNNDLHGSILGSDFSCEKPTLLVSNMVPDFEHIRINADTLGKAYNVVDYDVRSCDPDVLRKSIELYVKAMRTKCRNPTFCPTDFNLSSHGLSPNVEPFKKCPHLLDKYIFRPKPAGKPPKYEDHYLQCESETLSTEPGKIGGRHEKIPSRLMTGAIDQAMKNLGCVNKSTLINDCCFAGSCSVSDTCNVLAHGSPDAITMAGAGQGYYFAKQICAACDANGDRKVSYREYEPCFTRSLQCLITHDTTPLDSNRPDCVAKTWMGPPVPSKVVDPKLTLLDCSGFPKDEKPPCAEVAPMPREAGAGTGEKKKTH